MPVFAVVLNEPNNEVEKRLKEKYEGCFALTDTFFLVQSEAIAENVAVDAGIKGEDRVETARGVVFKLNKSYSGYTSRALWDWLVQAEERA